MHFKAGLITLTFQTSVPNELEAIFRRGSEWDEGEELIVALQRHSSASIDDVEEFLDLTQQLATSSVYGAVQAASGPCLTGSTAATTATTSSSGGGDRVESGATSNEEQQQGIEMPQYVMIVRFQNGLQLSEFVSCPAVHAMLDGDERSPLKAIWAGILMISPAQNSKSSPQGRGGVL